MTLIKEIAGIAVLARHRRNRKRQNLTGDYADHIDQQSSPESPWSYMIATLGRSAGKIARFSAVWHL